MREYASRVIQVIEWVLITSVVTIASTYAVIVLERMRGLEAPDIHKPGKPRIPKTAGPAFITVLLCGLALSLIENTHYVAYHMIAALTAGLIGLYDDFKGINAVRKVLILTIPALPVIIGSSYVPRPYVPLIGHMRIHIVYPLLLLPAYTVSINAYNMIDTHNGVAVTSALVTSAALAISSVLGWGPPPMDGGLQLTVFVLAFLISYFAFNSYPARIFNGNSGSFVLGAIVASEAVLLRREYLLIMLSTPLIINGFSLITSVSGLKNKERITRPVELSHDMKIIPSRSREAPVTLVQLLVLRRPMNEKELVKSYSVLITLNAVASLIIYYVLSAV
ncbi:MAG: hypothetical protein QXP80_00655 [Zestosphaera sp.]